MDDLFETASLDDLFDVKPQDKESKAPKKPFKFLDYYEIEDRDIFCGRDLEIAEIYTRFFRSRILLLYGESGAGKTSLIRCGLQAELPKEDLHFLFLRSVNDPLESLRKEILRYISFPDGEPDSISDLLKETIFRKGKPLALVFDQFEEFFIFQPPDVRERFINEVSLWLETGIDLRIICCIREDYLARVTELEACLPQLYENKLWVRRMSRDQAEAVIIEPCKICGVNVEKELAKELLLSLGRDANGVELPILQVVLDSLYNSAVALSPESPALTLAAYREMGEIESILAQFVESKVASQSDPDQVRQILKTMVTVDGTRRVASLADIAKKSSQFGNSIPESRVESILRQLVDDRVVREDADNKVFELRHDTLARTIHRWLTGVEKELMDVYQLIQNRFNEYQSRGSLIDQSTLNYIKPYLKRLRLNIDLVEFIEKSIQRTKKSRQRLIRFAVVTTSIVFIVISSLAILSYLSLLESEHTLGIVYAEKAEKSFLNKEFNKANIYSLYALSLIDKNDKGSDRARAAGIILSSGDYPVIGSYPGKGEETSLREMTFANDGRKLAAGTLKNNNIRIWDLENDQTVAVLEVDQDQFGRMYSLGLSPDGSILAAGSLDNQRIYLWDVKSQKLAAILQDKIYQKGRITSLNFSRDGHILAAGSWDNANILLWNLEDKSLLGVLGGDIGKTAGYSYICLSPDARILAANLRNSNLVQVWDVDRQKVISTLDGGDDISGQVTAIGLSSDGKFLATGTKNNNVRIWDLSSQESVLAFDWHQSRIACISFSPDGCTLAVGSRDNAVKLWDVTDECVKTPIDESFRETNNITMSHLSPRGKLLATVHADNSISLWDLNSKQLTAELSLAGEGVAEGKISRLDISQDENVLAAVSRDNNTISLWDLEGRTLLNVIAAADGLDGSIYKTSLSAAGDILVVSFRNSEIVSLWDVRSGKKIKTLTHEGFGRVYSLALSPRGDLLAVGSRNDNTIRLWSLDSWQSRDLVAADSDLNNDSGVPSLSFSPDGKKLVSGVRGGSNINYWDLAKQELKVLEKSNAHGAIVSDLNFSSDGRKVAASSRGVNSIGIWDLDNGLMEVVLKARAVGVVSALFSEDDQSIIAVSRNNDVFVWNLAKMSDLKSVNSTLRAALKNYKFKKENIELFPQI